MTRFQTYHRNTDVSTLVGTALDLRAGNVDVVTNELDFFADGTVHVKGEHDVDAVLAPRAHAQVAETAGIPKAFYDRILGSHPDLWATNVNTLFPHVARLVRTSRRRFENGELYWLARAVLSDTYATIDNVDVLTSFLTVLAAEGLSSEQVEVQGDLDGDSGQLRMRVWVPSIGVAARDLVARYRSPFNGRTGTELPMIFAGLELSNNETGGGAYSIAPRAVLQVCTNGMTRDVRSEVFRRVHLGARLDDGVVRWSDETRSKQLDFIASAAGDAVRRFISPEYLRQIVDEASVAAGIEIDDITVTMSKVTKQHSLSDEEASRVLNLFTRSGDTSLLGLGHAVTALAQDVTSSDRQAELERAFWAIVGDHSLAAV